ncbi:MAG: ABC transporter permease [Dehalococcoidia bacterium]|jgi:ABC-type dipeptide/oligopeptide/nickel transport system permease subunit
MARKDINIEMGFHEAPPRINEWRRFVRVFFQRKMVIFGIFILLLLFFSAIFAEWLAPYDPYQPDYYNVYAQPSSEHLLGTDPIGRDTLSRLIFGTRTAILVGFVTAGFASIAGMVLGLIAGYFSGTVINMVIMRIMDLLMTFPMIILALFIASILGVGIQNVIIALGISALPGYARVMHGLSLSIKENDYIMAERSAGASIWRIMFRHILPNAAPPMIVLVTLQLGTLILAEAGLSFLGIGIKPPAAAWGAMVNDGRGDLATHPWLSLAPGVAIMVVVFAFNMVGDGLRDALDPKLRGTL